jgi:hypothetical protein
MLTLMLVQVTNVRFDEHTHAAYRFIIIAFDLIPAAFVIAEWRLSPAGVESHTFTLTFIRNNR